MHLRGVEPGPRLRARLGRRARASRPATRDPSGAAIRIEPAIEVGNIFKLGTRYSRAARRHATSTSTARSSRSGWAPTGSGRRASSPRRSSSSRDEARHLVAARARALRRRARHARQGGRAGPRGGRPPLRRAARRGPRRALRRPRRRAPGEKFADAELLGCPLRLTVGKRGRRGRRGGGRRSGAARRSARCRSRAPREAAAELWREPPLTCRRLVGLDRSGGAAARDARAASRSTRGRSPTRSASPGSR